MIINKQELQDAMNYRGSRDNKGRPISKYAFLTKEEIKQVSFLKTITASNGVRIVVRVIKG